MSRTIGEYVTNVLNQSAAISLNFPAMNRSPLPTKASSHSLSSKCDYDWFGEHEFPETIEWHATSSSHCLFAPIHYEPGYAYPLIVWLHGPVSNEQELNRAMPLISVRNYVAVAPRGTTPAGDMRGTYGWSQSPNDIVDAGNRVRECIEAASERFHIHPERVFIAGHAEGGTMALRLGLEQPDRFAGAISLGGPLPMGSCPFKRIHDLRKLPLLLSVSPDRTNYSLKQVLENDVRLLHSAGASLSLRLYPEGDSLTTVMMSDVNDWVMEQVCPAPSSAAS